MKDEEKPFDIGGQQDDDHQPDPEEDIMIKDTEEDKVGKICPRSTGYSVWADICQSHVNVSKLARTPYKFLGRGQQYCARHNRE